MENGYYNVLLLGTLDNSCITVKNFIEDIMVLLVSQLVIHKECMSANLRNTPRVISTANMFEFVKYSASWVIHRGKDRYVSNTLFLGTTTSGVGKVNPLFCVMVKKENAAYVKACFITNTPIPSSMIELWVDESVEATGSKMKPLFRKAIKSKLETSGVPVVYFSNLKEKIVRSLSLPTTATITELQEWKAEMLNGMYRKQESIIPFNDRITLQDERIKIVLDEFRTTLERLATEV
jgi:hypothetical protein